MVQNHWKPLKAIVARPKTIEKPLMAMVRLVRIQNHWNFQWFPKYHCTYQWSPQNNEIHLLTIALEISKTLKSHWNQWFGPPKTFSGDGPTALKPLKDHRSQRLPKKNINHSIALKNWPSLWSMVNTNLSKARLAECEVTVESLNSKLMQLEKSKAQLQVRTLIVQKIW